MKDPLRELVAKQGFRWMVNPADSPWRQGKPERRIGVIKRLLKISMGDCRLTALKVHLFLMEAADMSNNRLISVHKRIPADGSYQILTPNCLLLGRATNKLAQDDSNEDFCKKSDRLQLVADVTQHFWKRWAAEVTPMKVVWHRWHKTGRNLHVGDLVLVHETSKVKNN